MRGHDGEQVHEVATPTFRVGSKPGANLIVDDDAVSRIHFEIVADDLGHRIRDLGSTNGTFVDGLRVIDAYVRDGAQVAVGRTRLDFHVLATDVEVPSATVDRCGGLLGASPAMSELFAQIEQVATTNVTVLLEGESGTGKELAAEAIHQASPRAAAPFVVFDCAAVSPSLIESALFGHERGAFTGATERRAGCFEQARGGTLFLDEVGELPLELQPKLLRALEKRGVRRVGGADVVPVDVRVLGATNRDLAREVNRGTFRDDLYYRIAVIRLVLPPLRDRSMDLPRLVAHFAEMTCDGDPARARTFVQGISAGVWQRLRGHAFPGNVRELRNLVQRAITFQGSASVDPWFFQERARSEARAEPAGSAAPVDRPAADRPFGEARDEVLREFERAYLETAMARAGGKISKAAGTSGLDRTHFKRLLKKHGLG